MRVPNFETGMLKWFFQLQDRKFEILNLSTIDSLKTLCGVHTVFFQVYRSVQIVCGWFNKQSVDTRWYKHVVSCWRFICQRSYSEWLPHSNRFWRYIVAYLNMYIKPFLPACRTSFRMDVWHLVWLRWCVGTLIRRACMCLFTSTNPLSTGRQLVDSKTIKPSNHPTTFNINNISLNYPLKLGQYMALLFCIFLCWGGCQKPSENQTTSLHMLHYPLENIWLIFMKGQQDSIRFLFSRRPSAPMILARAAHWVRKTSCGSAEGGSKQRRELRLNRERAAAPGHWGNYMELWEL